MDETNNKKKILVIINPKAGKLKTKRQLFDIAEVLSSAGNETTVYTTTCRGDATRMARDLSEPYDIVVCRGGDGTLNEVVSGMMAVEEGKRKPIGYIPSGTTNDLARSLGISHDSKKSALQVLNGSLYPHDVGSFNENKFFTYVACFGAFITTTYKTSQVSKNFLGHAAYMAKAVDTLKEIHHIKVKITIDDDEVIEDDIIYGSVSNTLSLAKIITIDKNLVNFNDGLFEVVLAKFPKNANELTKTIRCLLEKDYNEKYIYFRQASKIKIEFDKGVAWSLDGEYGGDPKEVVIENKHQAINIIR